MNNEIEEILHTNGTCADYAQNDDEQEQEEKEEENDDDQTLNNNNNNSSADPSVSQDSNHLTTGTEAAETASPPQTQTQTTPSKGYGLKKWRRIKRDITKDAHDIVDSNKNSKRVHFLDGNHNDNDSRNHNQPSDGSTSSTNAILHTAQSPAQLFSLPAIASTFNSGVDSDNSEDRSSKSSTAASVPKHHRASGHQRDKHKSKTPTGRNSSVIGPRSQLGKALPDASKKHRGETHYLDKESSLSSLESDSRSCNYVPNRATSSQVQSGKSEGYSAEDIYDEPSVGEHSVEQPRVDCGIYASLSEDNLDDFSWDNIKDNGKNHQLSPDHDSMVSSILMLQSAQLALEREVQIFGEIGKGIRSLCDNSSVYSPSSNPEVCIESASDGCDLEFNHAYFSKKYEALESRLSEADDQLRQKDLRIVELETIIESRESPLGDTELQHKRDQEEAELENLFKRRVETEVVLVAMASCADDMGFLIKDKVKLLMEQSYLAREQAQSLETIAGVREKAVKLERRAEKLDTLCKEITGDEEIPRMRRRVVKITSYLSLQLVLLVLVLGLFILQFLPKPAVIVPT